MFKSTNTNCLNFSCISPSIQSSIYPSKRNGPPDLKSWPSTYTRSFEGVLGTRQKKTKNVCSSMTSWRSFSKYRWRGLATLTLRVLYLRRRVTWDQPKPNRPKLPKQVLLHVSPEGTKNRWNNVVHWYTETSSKPLWSSRRRKKIVDTGEQRGR